MTTQGTFSLDAIGAALAATTTALSRDMSRLPRCAA